MIKWKTEIREKILEALANNPEARFPTIRSVWYYLWSALGVIPGIPQTYKKVDELVVWMRKEGDIPFGRFEVARGTSGEGGRFAYTLETFVEAKMKKVLEMVEDYKLPTMFMQPFLIEVWVEKKGLIRTFEMTCDEYDIKVRSPEGFSPWEFVYSVIDDWQDYFRQRKEDKVILLYFGDQDPSGENIYEAIIEQLNFFGVDHDCRRIGITIDQIREFNLPETPLDRETLEKIRRDSRYPKYIQKYGREIFCELDAFISLAYDNFKATLETAITSLIDEDCMRERNEENQKRKERLDEALSPDKDNLEEIKHDILERLEE
jgi:hypothetical protein